MEPRSRKARLAKLAVLGILAAAAASLVPAIRPSADSGSGDPQRLPPSEPVESQDPPPRPMPDEGAAAYRVDLLGNTYSVVAGEIERGESDQTASLRCRVESDGSSGRLHILDIERGSASSFVLLDDNVLSRQGAVSFRVGRDSSISLDAGAGSPSPARGLVRLFVPLLPPPAGEQFKEAEENTLRWIAGDMALQGQMEWPLHVERVTEEPNPGDLEVVVFHHFDPRPIDPWGASRLYAGGWLVGADGLARVSYIRLKEGSESTDADHDGLEIRSTCLREPAGPGDQSGLSLLRRLVDAHIERMSAEIPTKWTPFPRDADFGPPPPGPDRPRILLPIPFEVRTDSYGEIVDALRQTNDHYLKDRNSLFAVRWLAREAARDPLIKDRLFEIVHGAEDLAIRRLALFALGMTTESTVRLALLEFAGAPGTPESLRTDALRAVFMERSPGIGVMAGKLGTYNHGVDDPAVFRAILDWSTRRELPEEMRNILAWGFGATYETLPPEDHGMVSAVLREMYQKDESIEVRRRALGALSGALNEENWRIIVSALTSEEEQIRQAAFFSTIEFGRYRKIDPALERTMARDLLEIANGMELVPFRAEYLKRVPITTNTVADYCAAVRTQIFRPPAGSEPPAFRSGERDNIFVSMRDQVRDDRAASELIRFLRDIRGQLEDDPSSRAQLDRTLEILQRNRR